MDFLKGSGSGSNKCAYCKTEDKNLPFSKKLDGETHRFCSRECSRKFRIARKKAAKKPPAAGPSLPW
jgi:YHS domain-containing protein